MKIRAFITHKKAEHFSDCQDRFSINPDTKSVAVSDGMSQSWQQKIWAQLLVNTFCSDTDWKPTLESARELSPIWRKAVEEYIQSLRDTDAKESLIYRNERNLAEGQSAGATLVGIRFKANNWTCNVLGDSCLIAKIGGEYIFGTSQDVEKFDNNPDYLDSASNKKGRGTCKMLSEVMSSSNPFVLLVSDPFSDYLLEHKKIGDIDALANELLTINTHDEFEALVAKWRNAGMHNDDSTIIIMEYDGADEWTILHQDDLDVLIQNEQEVTKVPISITNTEEPLPHQPSPISKEEFCKEFISLSENIFSISPLRFLLDNKAKRREKLNLELMNIAEKLYNHFEIRKK